MVIEVLLGESGEHRTGDATTTDAEPVEHVGSHLPGRLVQLDLEQIREGGDRGKR